MIEFDFLAQLGGYILKYIDIISAVLSIAFVIFLKKFSEPVVPINNNHIIQQSSGSLIKKTHFFTLSDFDFGYDLCIAIIISIALLAEYDDWQLFYAISYLLFVLTFIIGVFVSEFGWDKESGELNKTGIFLPILAGIMFVIIDIFIIRGGKK